MTTMDMYPDKEFLQHLREHVTTELGVLRVLLEKAVEQVHKTQVLVTIQNENTVRIAHQLENLEKAVIHGNGQYGLLTRVALLEQQLKENQTTTEETMNSGLRNWNEHKQSITDKLAVIEKEIDDIKVTSINQQTAKRTVILAMTAAVISLFGVFVNILIHYVS